MKLPAPDVSDYDIPKRLPGVHALKRQVREFERDLLDCGDGDALLCLLMVSAPLIVRIQAELPDWWDGRAQGDPAKGYEAMIETRRKELNT